MKVYSLKVFLLHLAIALTYTTWNYYYFVVSEFPDPIGTGLRQWFFTFLHLTITLFVTLTVWSKVEDKKWGRSKFLVNLLSIVSIAIIHLFLSNWIWGWLWALR